MNTPLRRSGMVRVLKGSYSFTCTPRVHHHHHNHRHHLFRLLLSADTRNLNYMSKQRKPTATYSTHLLTEWTKPAFSFPAEAGPHFPTP